MLLKQTLDAYLLDLSISLLSHLGPVYTATDHFWYLSKSDLLQERWDLEVPIVESQGLLKGSSDTANRISFAKDY